MSHHMLRTAKVLGPYCNTLVINECNRNVKDEIPKGVVVFQISTREGVMSKGETWRKDLEFKSLQNSYEMQ